jgi:hypothetical protein
VLTPYWTCMFSMPLAMSCADIAGPVPSVIRYSAGTCGLSVDELVQGLM